ncbi:hypothetical protein A3Q56_02228 [Intoshia linei]|uniref:PX domain-containing protein n=1 Tax=Intoshia linei TaxID=1819745 RepID=A0A177B7C2_9BILA|nr:hypothetical protein A3Q56_02228 [Intoshia linei]
MNFNSNFSSNGSTYFSDEAAELSSDCDSLNIEHDHFNINNILCNDTEEQNVISTPSETEINKSDCELDIKEVSNNSVDQVSEESKSNQDLDKNMILNNDINPTEDVQMNLKTEKSLHLNIIKVSNPTKCTVNFKHYILYNVETKIHKFNEIPITYNAKRRFNHFSWLKSCLTYKYTNIVIPTLPMSSAKDRFVRFDANFIAKRSKSLEFFLKNVVKHPILSTSKDLFIFLTETENNLIEFMSKWKLEMKKLKLIYTKKLNSSHSNYEFKMAINCCRNLCKTSYLLETNRSEYISKFKNLNQIILEWSKSEKILKKSINETAQIFNNNVTIFEKEQENTYGDFTNLFYQHKNNYKHLQSIEKEWNDVFEDEIKNFNNRTNKNLIDVFKKITLEKISMHEKSIEEWNRYNNIILEEKMKFIKIFEKYKKDPTREYNDDKYNKDLDENINTNLS